MSFIRGGSDPEWVDDADTDLLYVYTDGDEIRRLPSGEEEFVEVTMRMLDQSGELSDEELEKVLNAFETRLRWNWNGERISEAKPDREP